MKQCPVCGGSEFKGKQLLPEIAVDNCIRCGLLISRIDAPNPAPAEFSRINKEAYQDSIGMVRRQQASEIVGLVKTHSKHGYHWLDVGCSFGYLLFEAKQAGYNVFGIEPDENAYREACRLVGSRFVSKGMMDDSSRPDESTDIISMLDVLEHIPAALLPDFARMIRKKLRPQGLCVIKVPSTEGLYFGVAHSLLPFLTHIVTPAVKRLWQADYEFPHTVYFNQRTLRMYLESHGYEVILTKYMQEVPNGTIMDRLLMDDTIPHWQAWISLPAVFLINAIEKLRGRSDALLVLARRVR